MIKDKFEGVDGPGMRALGEWGMDVKFIFDEQSRIFHFPGSKMDMTDFYLIGMNHKAGKMHTETKGHGGLGSAFVGGALAGGLGAVVGFNHGRQYETNTWEDRTQTRMIFIDAQNIIDNRPNDTIVLRWAMTTAEANAYAKVCLVDFEGTRRNLIGNNSANIPVLNQKPFDTLTPPTDPNDDAAWAAYLAQERGETVSDPTPAIPEPQTSPTSSYPNQSMSIGERLDRLEKALNNGQISNDEYEAEMRKAVLANDGVDVAPKQQTVADQLRDMKSLLDDGVITQDDFDAKKKELLGL
ncbi:SHOCT domain-containing protein [Lacticaseibacillus pabuli]|uniref:SHOCT domain-containing protein n=1 Tax=Lacticaseibacillus pabuli TaxID=3025672 RepID=A0ABY7X082_9LACO|nr:SHOCT domain-containing protein [Lacticaseibacillus sp. KACC 23028]WDF83560.1 SHOCT domain-containing protein [Lacticaseibacillus sp. KACC 23028]